MVRCSRKSGPVSQKLTGGEHSAESTNSQECTEKKRKKSLPVTAQAEKLIITEENDDTTDEDQVNLEDTISDSSQLPVNMQHYYAEAKLHGIKSHRKNRVDYKDPDMPYPPNVELPHHLMNGGLHKSFENKDRGSRLPYNASTQSQVKNLQRQSNYFERPSEFYGLNMDHFNKSSAIEPVVSSHRGFNTLSSCQSSALPDASQVSELLQQQQQQQQQRQQHGSNLSLSTVQTSPLSSYFVQTGPIDTTSLKFRFRKQASPPLHQDVSPAYQSYNTAINVPKQQVGKRIEERIPVSSSCLNVSSVPSVNRDQHSYQQVRGTLSNCDVSMLRNRGDYHSLTNVQSRCESATDRLIKPHSKPSSISVKTETDSFGNLADYQKNDAAKPVCGNVSELRKVRVPSKPSLLSPPATSLQSSSKNAFSTPSANRQPSNLFSSTTASDAFSAFTGNANTLSAAVLTSQLQQAWILQNMFYPQFHGFPMPLNSLSAGLGLPSGPQDIVEADIPEINKRKSSCKLKRTKNLLVQNSGDDRQGHIGRLDSQFNKMHEQSLKQFKTVQRKKPQSLKKALAERKQAEQEFYQLKRALANEISKKDNGRFEKTFGYSLPGCNSHLDITQRTEQPERTVALPSVTMSSEEDVASKVMDTSCGVHLSQHSDAKRQELPTEFPNRTPKKSVLSSVDASIENVVLAARSPQRQTAVKAVVAPQEPSASRGERENLELRGMREVTETGMVSSHACTPYMEGGMCERPVSNNQSVNLTGVNQMNIISDKKLSGKCNTYSNPVAFNAEREEHLTPTYDFSDGNSDFSKTFAASEFEKRLANKFGNKQLANENLLAEMQNSSRIKTLSDAIPKQNLVDSSMYIGERASVESLKVCDSQATANSDVTFRSPPSEMSHAGLNNSQFTISNALPSLSEDLSAGSGLSATTLASSAALNTSSFIMSGIASTTTGIMTYSTSCMPPTMSSSTLCRTTYDSLAIPDSSTLRIPPTVLNSYSSTSIPQTVTASSSFGTTSLSGTNRGRSVSILSDGFEVDVKTEMPENKAVLSSVVDSYERLKLNLKEEVPECNCTGEGRRINEEKCEGPYYTHLGAAPNVPGIRKLVEERTGVTGSAIRIEKLCYTGKEGATTEGCPIAKWILRRVSYDEKYLVCVRQRPHHHCDTAVLIIAFVCWEGVPREEADTLYTEVSKIVVTQGIPTVRRCGLNEMKTCACQGTDPDTCGASFSFGCSWSMYYNGCKFARSRSPRKFRMMHATHETDIEHKLQALATHLAPLYKQLVPTGYANQTAFEDQGMECRLGDQPGRPFSGVTAVVDFCAHSHKDLHNMNNGVTVVVTLTKHRDLKKPDDEQLHVLPLYVLDTTDEYGSYEGQQEKIRTGAIEVLQAFKKIVRTRSQRVAPCRRVNSKNSCKVPGFTRNSFKFAESRTTAPVVNKNEKNALQECSSPQEYFFNQLKQNPNFLEEQLLMYIQTKNAGSHHASGKSPVKPNSLSEVDRFPKSPSLDRYNSEPLLEKEYPASAPNNQNVLDKRLNSTNQQYNQNFEVDCSGRSSTLGDDDWLGAAVSKLPEKSASNHCNVPIINNVNKIVHNDISQREYSSKNFLCKNNDSDNLSEAHPYVNAALKDTSQYSDQHSNKNLHPQNLNSSLQCNKNTPASQRLNENQANCLSTASNREQRDTGNYKNNLESTSNEQHYNLNSDVNKCSTVMLNSALESSFQCNSEIMQATYSQPLNSDLMATKTALPKKNSIFKKPGPVRGRPRVKTLPKCLLPTSLKKLHKSSLSLPAKHKQFHTPLVKSSLQHKMTGVHSSRMALTRKLQARHNLMMQKYSSYSQQTKPSSPSLNLQQAPHFQKDHSLPSMQSFAAAPHLRQDGSNQDNVFQQHKMQHESLLLTYERFIQEQQNENGKQVLPYDNFLPERHQSDFCSSAKSHITQPNQTVTRPTDAQSGAVSQRHLSASFFNKSAANSSQAQMAQNLISNVNSVTDMQKNISGGSSEMPSHPVHGRSEARLMSPWNQLRSPHQTDLPSNQPNYNESNIKMASHFSPRNVHQLAQHQSASPNIAPQSPASHSIQQVSHQQIPDQLTISQNIVPQSLLPAQHFSQHAAGQQTPSPNIVPHSPSLSMQRFSHPAASLNVVPGSLSPSMQHFSGNVNELSSHQAASPNTVPQSTVQVFAQKHPQFSAQQAVSPSVIPHSPVNFVPQSSPVPQYPGQQTICRSAAHQSPVAQHSTYNIHNLSDQQTASPNVPFSSSVHFFPGPSQQPRDHQAVSRNDPQSLSSFPNSSTEEARPKLFHGQRRVSQGHQFANSELLHFSNSGGYQNIDFTSKHPEDNGSRTPLSADEQASMKRKQERHLNSPFGSTSSELVGVSHRQSYLSREPSFNPSFFPNYSTVQGYQASNYSEMPLAPLFTSQVPSVSKPYFYADIQNKVFLPKSKSIQGDSAPEDPSGYSNTISKAGLISNDEIVVPQALAFNKHSHFNTPPSVHYDYFQNQKFPSPHMIPLHSPLHTNYHSAANYLPSGNPPFRHLPTPIPHSISNSYRTPYFSQPLNSLSNSTSSSVLQSKEISEQVRISEQDMENIHIEHGLPQQFGASQESDVIPEGAASCVTEGRSDEHELPRIKESLSENVDRFLDPTVGGVAVALCHGAVLFECAKRELHATTAIKNPNRLAPTRISLVFYQHKNLNSRYHGLAEYEKKAEERRQEKLAKGEELSRKGRKRKLSAHSDEPLPACKNILPCSDGIMTKRFQTQTTDTLATIFSYAFTKVTGPYSRFI